VSEDRAAAILERLRDHGGRVTRPRRIVIDAMLAAPEHHLTGPDVVAAVRRSHPDFYESTVYRTLDRLVELGAVERLHLGPGPAVFHLAAGHAHHHLVCDQCGAVVEIDGSLLGSLARRVRAEHGFVLRPEATTLGGRCASCA
jgi:Fur family ferric uptake transcriptional regulator